ncbi:hypothetical protein [Streptomyces sp. NPDC086519]|uniref:hypothetical protein n=1 Tax=Streptomyces sp. NPDC086519 TaxID=3154863 RepID=UPI003441661D
MAGPVPGSHQPTARRPAASGTAVPVDTGRRGSSTTTAQTPHALERLSRHPAERDRLSR